MTDLGGGSPEGVESPNSQTAWLSRGSILGEEQGEGMLLPLEARSEAAGRKQGEEAHCVAVKSEQVESDRKCMILSAPLADCCVRVSSCGGRRTL